MKQINIKAVCPLCKDLKPLDPTIRIEHNVYLDDKLCIPYLCKSCFNMLSNNNLTVMFEAIKQDADISITGNHHIIKKKDQHIIMYLPVKDFKKQLKKYRNQLN